jgi:hypothetical protein
MQLKSCRCYSHVYVNFKEQDSSIPLHALPGALGIFTIQNSGDVPELLMSKQVLRNQRMHVNRSGNAILLKLAYRKIFEQRLELVFKKLTVGAEAYEDDHTEKGQQKTRV